jgi:hypothetical protein
MKPNVQAAFEEGYRKAPVRITDSDRQTRLCAEMLNHIDTRIDYLQRKNEKKSLSETDTADIRGAIGELRNFRKLLNPKPVPPVSPVIPPYD